MGKAIVNPELGQRICQARERLGMSQEELARRCGVSQGAVGNWEAGTVRRPGPLRELARALQVDEGWLLTGDGANDDFPQPAKDRMQFGLQDHRSLDNNRPIVVRELEIRAGGGGLGLESGIMVKSQNGIVINSDIFGDEWGVPRTFLAGELRIAERAAHILEIHGDSMYDPAKPDAPGSLNPGDRVIIDTGDRIPSPPGHFVVWDGLGLVVKQVEVVPGSRNERIRLSSRNPAYPPYEVTAAEATIVGRVKAKIARM